MSWLTVQTDYFTLTDLAPENMTLIQLWLQKSLQTTVYKHSLSYQFSNFIADFGGYLGLLLGASLISIYDCFVGVLEDMLKRLRKRALGWNNNS